MDHPAASGEQIADTHRSNWSEPHGCMAAYLNRRYANTTPAPKAQTSSNKRGQLLRCVQRDILLPLHNWKRFFITCNAMLNLDPRKKCFPWNKYFRVVV